MPIPKNPGELREMMRERISAIYADSNLEHIAACPTCSDDWIDILSNAALRALAEYDPCFAKAAEAGEPTFTLRAQDILAAELIETWIWRNEEEGTPKLTAARRIANAMRTWSPRKLPD